MVSDSRRPHSGGSLTTTTTSSRCSKACQCPKSYCSDWHFPFHLDLHSPEVAPNTTLKDLKQSDNMPPSLMSKIPKSQYLNHPVCDPRTLHINHHTNPYDYSELPLNKITTITSHSRSAYTYPTRNTLEEFEERIFSIKKIKRGGGDIDVDDTLLNVNLPCYDKLQIHNYNYYLNV